MTTDPEEIADAQQLTDATFDLALADEAHRCAGRVSGAFATILKAEAIRADRRLFMTATPRYFTGRVKKVAGLCLDLCLDPTPPVGADLADSP